MSVCRSIFFLMLAALVSMPAQAAWPPEFRATYQLHKLGMNAAEVRSSLETKADGSMLYKSKTETKGLVSMFRSDKITEKTVLEKSGSQWRPLSYRYIHKGSKKNRNRSVDFDYANNRANCISRGKPSEHTLQKDMHDGFSLQLKLMHDLHEGKTDLDYQVIYKGKIKRYRFENMGNETIETNAGTYNTVKLKRSREGGKRTTYMWVASQLHFLPVRIKHVEKDGTEFSLELEKIAGAITGKQANK